MKILHEDKYQIELVNQQVCLLLEKGATDRSIFEALIDFVPDMKHLLESAEEKELKLYIDANRGFAYFLSILAAR